MFDVNVDLVAPLHGGADVFGAREMMAHFLKRRTGASRRLSAV